MSTAMQAPAALRRTKRTLRHAASATPTQALLALAFLTATGGAAAQALAADDAAHTSPAAPANATAEPTAASAAKAPAPAPGTHNAHACIAPITYLPLDAQQAGADDNGLPALGSYERISPDGRFVLRSYSGARWGQVSLVELPAQPGGAFALYRTPLSNEAFPVQGSWRYVADANGAHYRLADIVRQQQRARALFKGGMTGFYAAAAEMPDPAHPADAGRAGAADAPAGFFIRSLSWPQSADADRQGTGALQMQTLHVIDDGRSARIAATTGVQHICAQRNAIDGNIYALPMLAVDGTAFSAVPQTPAAGTPTMRVYGLSPEPLARQHPCDLRADLGHAPAKAVFGFAPSSQNGNANNDDNSADGSGAAWLTYSDIGRVYVRHRGIAQSLPLDHGRDGVLASAFPGLTRDGRVIYAATWKDCPAAAAAAGQPCTARAGYVVADPYQSRAWRAHWQAQGRAAPRGCITRAQVAAERARFAQLHGLPDAPGQSTMPNAVPNATPNATPDATPDAAHGASPHGAAARHTLQNQ